MTPSDLKREAETIVTKFNSEGTNLSNTDESYLEELLVNAFARIINAAKEEDAKIAETMYGTQFHVREVRWTGRKIANNIRATMIPTKEKS
jgi:hypothetical protein